MTNLSSESPTHPDAPRAGGETVKSLFAFASRAYVLLDNVTDDDECVRDHHGNCQTHLGERECSHAAARKLLDDYSDTLDEIEAALPSLLERHRDGERDTKLLDWLTASCRDLIHSEGGKWEVIEYPGDPLVEERRAIGSTPREALIVAGALRVAHPYDAPAASPPAASDGTWVDIERIKPNCMPPLFDEKRPPAASPEPTVNSNDR